MKILYVVSDPTIKSLSNAGYTTHISSVIDGLINRGVSVKVMIAGDTLNPGGRAERFVNIRKRFPLVLRRLKRDLSFIFHDFSWTKEIIRAAKVFKPDIIYERSAFLHTSGARASKRLKIPLVLEINSPADEIRSLGVVYFGFMGAGS